MPQATTAGPDHIGARLEQMIANAKLVSVAAALIHNDDLLWAGAYGWADRERQQPATLDTPYYIASIGKAITATALLKLADDGLIVLDQPLPDIPGRPSLWLPDGMTAPTIRQLLDMTGGIPHGALTVSNDTIAIDEPALRLRQAMVVFPPGEVFHYSNFSIATLEGVIEAITGTPFPLFIEQTVFAPLGMTQSSARLWSVVGNSAARRYNDAGQRIGPVIPLPRSSRQMSASVNDLVRFARLQLQTPDAATLLRQETLRAMQTSRSTLPGAHMALGIGSIKLDDGSLWLATTGNDLGTQASVMMLPQRGLAAIVLTNTSGYQADELAVQLLESAAPGFAAMAFARMRAHQGRSQPFQPNAHWQGRWRGVVDTARAPLVLELDIGGDGHIRVTWDGADAGLLTGSTLRDGVLNGSLQANLPVLDERTGNHRVELTLYRSGDRLLGFALADRRSALGRIELPTPARLARIGVTKQSRTTGVGTPLR